MHAVSPSVLRVTASVDALTCASVARRIAAEAGFSREAAAEIGTCASELATNLVRHASGGTLEVVSREAELVLRATDRGPGTARALEQRLSLIRSEQDHPSALHGLGVLIRWMDEIEVCDAECGGLDIRTRRKLVSRRFVRR